MAGYELRITAPAAKELDRLPRRKDRQAIVDRILALADEPRPVGCTKLSGRAHLYRVRVGPYRIVYSIEDDRLLVVVIRIADRKDAYRKRRRERSAQRSRPFPRRR